MARETQNRVEFHRRWIPIDYNSAASNCLYITQSTKGKSCPSSMSSLWNFLFSFERNLTSYTVEELNSKMKELELDKHLDSLEKAFEVQKTIIDKLKAENDQLKKELRELRGKTPEGETSRPVVPYPDLKNVLCHVKWSPLENNAIESRVVEKIRDILVTEKVELEVQPWSGSRSKTYPVLVFCPVINNNVLCAIELALNGLADYTTILLLVMHERRDPSQTGVSPTLELLRDCTPARTNMIKLVVDLFYQDRKLVECNANEVGLKALVSLIGGHAGR